MYLGYGNCPQCRQAMEPPGWTDWEGETIEEEFYCEHCEIEVSVISERVKGCHWCESEGSVSWNEDKYLWYCRKCHIMTESREDEHWYRWVSSEIVRA